VKSMSDEGAYQFIHSRGYARYALAKVFNQKPLEIPLKAEPQSPPRLPQGYGYISISHCKDMLAIVWSCKKVGIDIERFDRKISGINYFRNLFLDDLNSINIDIQDNKRISSQILDFWVLYESLAKWERSSIFKGLKDWKLSHNLNYGENNKGFKVKIQKIDLIEWKIGLASNHLRNFHPLQVCFN